MANWACTHEDRHGNSKTVIHIGNQCTDEWHQDNDCHLFHKTWKFISCESRAYALEGDHVIAVDPDTWEDEGREQQQQKVE